MFYKSYMEAHEAAQKLRQQHSGNGIMVKVEKSNYGGFQVKLIPLDMLLDDLSSSFKEPKSPRPTVCC